MTYRELAYYVLDQGGRMDVRNPGGRGPLRLCVIKGDAVLAYQSGLTLDEAADRCAAQLREIAVRP